MLLLNLHLECAAIKTITQNPKYAEYLLPRLDVSHFFYDPAKIMFQRIQTLTRQKAKIPHWDVLMDDMTLPVEVRELVRDDERTPFASKARTIRAVETLEKYRRARALYKISRDIAQALKGDSVDLDKLIDKVSTGITQTRLKTNLEEQMIHLGMGKDNSDFFDRLLSGAALEVLPTGFTTFDARNKGIARGDVFVLAATSGGGKSVMALVVAMAQALMGLKVCIMSLEMKREQILLRMFSKLTRIDHNKFLRAEDLTKAERAEYRETMARFERRVEKNGGRLTIISPEDDLTLEDALLLVQPYDFDNIILDYLGLFSGMDGENQWMKMGAGVRFAKRYAAAHNNVVTILAQLGDDGDIRYSKAIREHAANMWTWVYKEQETRDSHIISIKQQKARMQMAFDFTLNEQFSFMDIMDAIVDASNDAQVVKPKGKKKKQTEDAESTYSM